MHYLNNGEGLTQLSATGAIKHTLSTSVEPMYEKQVAKGFSTTALIVPEANLYNPNSNVSLPVPYASGADTAGHTTTGAAYIFDTLKLTDRWQLNGGVRFERYNTETDSTSLSTATSHPTLLVSTLMPSKLKNSDNLSSWKVGALYKPAVNGSIYAAYANSYTPPGGAKHRAQRATCSYPQNPKLGAGSASSSPIR